MVDSDATDILVVDDLPEKLLVYRTLLEDLGQNLITASSGEDALRHILQNDFSVILLDVNMPTMDGFETARLIRQRKRSAHTPIIFITSYADEMQTAEAYSHGAVDFMTAPVVPTILRAKVRVFVDLFRLNRQIVQQANERIALAEERTKRLAVEEANRNLSFLAKCRAVLGESLDLETTIQDLARLAVPYLADWSVVVVPGLAPGDIKIATAQSTGKGPPLVTMGAYPADATPQTIDFLKRIGESGQVDLYLDSRESSSSPSTLALPLVARGQSIGVMGLHRDGHRGVCNSTEYHLAESLVSRAAGALDNARLYSALQETDRQRTEFLSMLAHELRNPLAPIRNAVELLRSDIISALELKTSREIISRQVQHLVRLVDDLLDVSRITQGKIRLQQKPVNVQSLVNQAVEASTPDIRSRKHDLKIDIRDEPLFVMGDATRLTQVLTNLLNNAAKYTEDGGLIQLSVHRENEWIIFRVKDNGMGIPTEMIPKIFDLFTQVDRSLDRSQGGLGIGLTLAHRLVEMHDGKLKAQSGGDGQGSEFIIQLRSCAALETDRSMDTSFRATGFNDARDFRLLIVDDNRDSADSLAMVLELAGYTSRKAYDGPSALNIAADYRPHVVLLDIGLPGLDGYEVARRLRSNETTRSTYLIALTGYGHDDNRQLAMTAGFDCHFVKPVELHQLIDILKVRNHVSTSAVASN